MLGLTIAGAIKIAIYDDEIHGKTLEAYLHSTPVKRNEVKDRLKFYIYLANDYCRSNFVEPDYSIINKLAMQFKISPENELYLPENLRVKVEIPHDEPSYKKKQEAAPGPRKPLPPTFLLSKKVFEFSPADRSKTDDIAEAIKFVGYMAAGIHGSVFNAQDAMQSFMSKAQLKIDEMLEKGQKYTLDLVTMINTVDEFIEWTITKHNALPHIKKISSAEDAKLKAHQAIAEFAPKLLKPFREKGIV
jgi:hypothetical protein